MGHQKLHKEKLTSVVELKTRAREKEQLNRKRKCVTREESEELPRNL